MAGFVLAGERVADIGSDHAYVPIYLVREGISPFAVLTDIKPGPLEQARISVERACLSDRIDFRLGDGLEALEKAEVDTVMIAGMGGETIISILEADKEKASSFRKYILQPRTKTELLVRWLCGEDFKVLEKMTADERGRLCDIIVCAPKEGEL